MSSTDAEMNFMPTKSKNKNRSCAVALWLSILMLIFLTVQSILCFVLVSQCKLVFYFNNLF